MKGRKDEGLKVILGLRIAELAEDLNGLWPRGPPDYRLLRPICLVAVCRGRSRSAASNTWSSWWSWPWLGLPLWSPEWLGLMPWMQQWLCGRLGD